MSDLEWAILLGSGCAVLTFLMGYGLGNKYPSGAIDKLSTLARQNRDIARMYLEEKITLEQALLNAHQYAKAGTNFAHLKYEDYRELMSIGVDHNCSRLVDPLL